MSETDETYKVYAIKYGHHAFYASPASPTDLHSGATTLDYFIWALVGPSRTFLLDTGFDEAMGAKRGRTLINPVEKGLAALEIDANKVQDIFISHMHFDHAGNHSLFPMARYHLQEREMAYCTGPCMCDLSLKRAFDPADIGAMVHRVFDGRVEFHDGNSEITSGIQLHRIGGHTAGLQVVRVRTAKGWMVLASDALHLYPGVAFHPSAYNKDDMLEGHSRVHALADRAELVIPGHDPRVMDRFPAPRKNLEGWVAQLA